MVPIIFIVGSKLCTTTQNLRCPLRSGGRHLKKKKKKEAESESESEESERFHSFDSAYDSVAYVPLMI